MSIVLTTPVTGGAQTGFTSPTYTIVQDNSVDGNVKRWIVTALGGTQTGVRAHSVSDEFSITIVKPKVMKMIQAFSSLLPNTFRPAFNRYWIIVRKGGIPASGLVAVPMVWRCSIDIPAGGDNYDAANVRGGLSMFIGSLNQVSSGIGDTLCNGVL
ncbi:coat protein [ssRNA phage Zoerhiza.1_9]|uniref:Coat protein n=2 Tax=Norzivirales TaxID=2842247 RepID=A0A8S5KY65_9VIRU|nr:coat protein [ssRNA phage Zoerhiza.1_9]QDH86945.1 MAG: hypothetical protein H1Rhizo25610_000002 [Leviviridae sp.]DAD50063.1 TPA_asm: coat protein [ssRNA phage Zoerhiza.1_9]